MFLTDGSVEVDSNVLERGGTDASADCLGPARGAEAWAILVSIINTAKLHELDRQTDLADLREKRVLKQTSEQSA